VGRTAIVAFLSVALVGCASGPPAVDRSFVTAAHSKKGVVIFTTARTGTYGSILSGKLNFRCEQGVRGEVADHGAFARYIDGEKLSIPISSSLIIEKNRPMAVIHMLELPAGGCEFYFYRAVAHGMNMITTANSKRPFSIKFNVVENQTTYIGGFNADWNARGGTPSFGDYFERDIAALKKQSPEVAVQDVKKEIASVRW
jgi:hypothetical protein